MDSIDLRSDTVTHPTDAMRKAMASAEVGDDVYGEDPTVNRLQEMVSELTGKQAGLFVSSGTMGNVAAILAHTRRGDEVICGLQSHMYRNEQGAMAALAGVQARPLQEQPDGTLALDEIVAAIQTSDDHHPITRMVAIENTHNLCGAVPLTAAYTRAVGEIAERHGLRFHLDGARLFNAAVALNVSAAELAAPTDSVSICLSKGLGAPVGSVLCGNADFIHAARRARKILGGGMRQAGVLAAAGVVALTTMVERLGDDHENAKVLARALAVVPGVMLDNNAAATNMVYFHMDQDVLLDASEVSIALKAQGVLLDTSDSRRLRVVTHYGVSKEMVERAVVVLVDVLKGALVR